MSAHSSVDAWAKAHHPDWLGAISSEPPVELQRYLCKSDEYDSVSQTSEKTETDPVERRAPANPIPGSGLQ